ncbi:MAG: DUF302 domain-containing protein [Rhodoplanes sp.]
MVLFYGHARGGTPIMLAAPQAALDLPLRVLVREDTDGRTVVSFRPAHRCCARRAFLTRSPAASNRRSTSWSKRSRRVRGRDAEARGAARPVIAVMKQKTSLFLGDDDRQPSRGAANRTGRRRSAIDPHRPAQSSSCHLRRRHESLRRPCRPRGKAR